MKCNKKTQQRRIHWNAHFSDFIRPANILAAPVVTVTFGAWWGKLRERVGGETMRGSGRVNGVSCASSLSFSTNSARNLVCYFALFFTAINLSLFLSVCLLFILRAYFDIFYRHFLILLRNLSVHPYIMWIAVTGSNFENFISRDVFKDSVWKTREMHKECQCH